MRRYPELAGIDATSYFKNFERCLLQPSYGTNATCLGWCYTVTPGEQVVGAEFTPPLWVLIR